MDARWCDRCGTLIMGRGCSCGSEARTFRINGPGDIRPAMGEGKDLILDLLRRNFGTDGGLGDRMLFLNKVPGEDRTDEVIAHGAVIAVVRFEVETNDFSIELRQAGAELLMNDATTNVVAFGNMSGHLKGKTVPGENIRSVKGQFPAGAPLILLKGTKVGPGIALVGSDDLAHAERAVKIKDLNNVSGMVLSPASDRNRFVESNRKHLMDIQSIFPFRYPAESPESIPWGSAVPRRPRVRLRSFILTVRIFGVGVPSGPERNQQDREDCRKGGLLDGCRCALHVRIRRVDIP